MSSPLLEMKSISKTFGGNLVLDKVDFTIWPGGVHALVGENGAGKSTLMKILAGVYTRDAGSICLEGEELKIENPHDARRSGISMIFQEHTLASHLTVSENIFLGVEPGNRLGILDRGVARSKAQEVLNSHGFPLSPETTVAALTRAEKQMVEIARALISATRVVVMDEPTAMLTRKESEELFRIIRGLRARGLGVVYISHRMEELPQIADQVTILRDGKRVHTGEFASLSTADVIRHMVGREIHDLYPPLAAPSEEAVLEVRNLCHSTQYRKVSFVLRRGEILGVAGLVGAGRTAVARGIFGLEPPEDGSLLLHGKPVSFHSSREAIDSGLAYLTEDRKISSLFPHLSVAHNISIAALQKVERGILLKLKEEARKCRELIGRIDIRARSANDPIYSLSGGNQQKSLFARWLFAEASILLLDEPTQGVDLGARVEIYKQMQEFVRSGGAILMISSDLPELLGMSHRIAVMRRGEIVADLDARRTDQEEIMRHAALIN